MGGGLGFPWSLRETQVPEEVSNGIKLVICCYGVRSYDNQIVQVHERFNVLSRQDPCDEIGDPLEVQG